MVADKSVGVVMPHRRVMILESEVRKSTFPNVMAAGRVEAGR
jgi:hypothetical protein